MASNQPESKTLRLKLIRTDGGTQPRAELCPETVDQYVEDLHAGDVFPPVDVFWDGAVYWLANGFHRLRAHLLADRREISCHVHKGSQRDAILFAFAANKRVGLRLTFDDRRRAAERMLADPEWSAWSSRAIARHIGMDEKVVRRVRKELAEESASAANPQMRVAARNGRVYPIDTGNIGSGRAELATLLGDVTPDEAQALAAAALDNEDGGIPCPCCAKRIFRSYLLENWQ